MITHLRPFKPVDAPLVATWLAEERNWKWLDFGRGVRFPGEAALRMMAQHNLHFMCLFSAREGSPLGLVALSDIDRAFRTARLWYLLGDKAHGGQGRTTDAVQQLLQIGFKDLSLRSIHAWAVSTNRASIRLLEKCGFNMIGRQRHCHVVDGFVCDRIHFDLLPWEAVMPSWGTDLAPKDRRRCASAMNSRREAGNRA